MIKILINLLLFISFINAIEIDVKYLHDIIKKNPDDVENRVILARYYFNKNESEKALNIIQKAIKLEPNNKQLLQLKSRIEHLQSTNVIFAELGVKNLNDREKIESYFKRIYKKREYKNYITLYDLVKNKIKFSQDIYVNAVDAALKVNAYKKAKDIFDKHNFSKAKKTPDQLKKKFPAQKSVTHLTEKTEQLEKNPVQDISINYLKEPSYKNLRAYALTLYGLGKTEKALNEVMNFIKKSPKNINAVLFLAQLYYWDGKKGKAEIILETVIHKTNKKSVHNLYKKILFEKKKHKKAEPLLSKPPKTNLKDKEIKRELTIPKKDGSEGLLKTAVKYHQTKDYKNALYHYKRYYNITKNKKVAKEIADIYYFDQKYDKSIPFYKSYLSKYPKEHDVHYRYAMALEYTKNYHEAVKEFHKLTKVKNTKSDYYYYHYGFNLMKIEDRAKAKAVFKKMPKRVGQEGEALPEYLLTFLQRWENAWESKNFNLYKKFYASTVYGQANWIQRKKSSFQNKKHILITTKDHIVIEKKNDKYKVKFYLNYNANSAVASGYNTMTIYCNEYKTNCKIIDEAFKSGRYKQNSNKLYQFTQSALEILNKPTPDKDIMLAEGGKKDLIDPKKLFSKSYAKGIKPKNIKSILPPYEYYDTNNTAKSVSVNHSYMSDADKIHLRDYSVNFNNIAQIGGWSVDLHGRRYELQNPKHDLNGNSFSAKGTKNGLSLSVGVNSVGDITEVAPMIEYHKKIKNHHINAELAYQNGVFYTNKAYMVKNDIKVAHAYISDTVKLKKGKEVYFGIGANHFSDGNLQLSSDLKLPIMKNKISNFQNNLDLYSKLIYYKDENKYYASDTFEDFNTLQFQTKYQFGNNGYLSGKGGVGYSFDQTNIIHNYGIEALYPITNLFNILLNCDYEKTSKYYSINQCNAYISYMW